MQKLAKGPMMELNAGVQELVGPWPISAVTGSVGNSITGGGGF